MRFTRHHVEAIKAYYNTTAIDLSGADLAGVDLSYLDLTGANLSSADLTNANMYGANLSGANLRDAIGNGKEIKTLQTEFYIVVMTKDVMHIGCERYSYNEWFNFTDDQIAKMDRNALKFWNKYKLILRELSK